MMFPAETKPLDAAHNAWPEHDISVRSLQ